MPFYPASTLPRRGQNVQMNMESEDRGLRFHAGQRYTLRYGIR